MVARILLRTLLLGSLLDIRHLIALELNKKSRAKEPSTTASEVSKEPIDVKQKESIRS